MERCTLIAALTLLWVWLTRPARARWVVHWPAQELALACGAAVLVNLVLVATIPHLSWLSPPTREVLAAFLRELATLIIVAPLMILALRWKRRDGEGRCRS